MATSFFRSKPAFFVLPVVLLSSPAWSQDEPKAKAIAADMFNRGVQLMTEHKCDATQSIAAAERAPCEEALDLFTRSYRAYPSALGALRNAAYVARGLGKIALAARDFREVERRAPLDPSPSKRRWAQPAAQEAALLEPRIPFVDLDIKPASVAGLTLRLDGEVLPTALAATKLPLDPGEHVVRIEAPGYQPVEARITLQERSVVPLQLSLEHKEASAASPAPAAQGGSLLRPPIARPSNVATLGPLITVIGGGALLATGGIFAVLAQSKLSDACDQTTRLCSSSDDLQTVHGHADRATAFLVAGSVVTAVGVGWWLWPSASSKGATTTMGSTRLTPWAEASGAGLAMEGRWP